MEINVKIKLCGKNKIPAYATSGSAAVDLRASTDTSITIPSGGRALIPTGIAISPERADVVAIIAARSGLAIKHGISLSNGIGVIDSDYRGEICVGLTNNSDKDFTVEPGDRIAQLMFMPVYTAKFIESSSLDETERGTGGFGSTGVKG